MTASSLPLPGAPLPIAEASTPPETALFAPPSTVEPMASCAYADDGRLAAAVDARSAWTDPGFYLAVPAALLIVMGLGTLRLYAAIAREFAAILA